MGLGFALPQFGGGATEGARLGEFATAAEDLGADSLWVGDRLLAPAVPTVGYAGTDTVPEEFRAALDPFTTLAVAAAVTRSARLGASVLVAPWYPPALLARALTSLDVVSGGRLVPGLGIGWSPEEYRAAGAGWARRGAALDEMLDALLALWTTDPAEHSGERWSVPAAHVLAPARRPHPPIHLGGGSPAALRRTGRRADGWLPVVRVPGHVDPAALDRQRAVLDAAARDAGREPAEVATVVRVNVVAGAEPSAVADAVATLAGSGYPEAFVDLLYVATGHDERLRWVERLLGTPR
ncbi:MAG TPA: TIGR03619 family F420-dependent LLM class oxidoreductase [Pseudonocardia sp.]|jgi:probable F420-dependent oxidoreductase